MNRRFLAVALLAALAGSLPASARKAARTTSPPAGRYALILGDAPLARQFATRKQLQTRSAARDARARIEAAQTTLRRSLAQAGIRITGSVNTLLNAVFVEATPDRIAALAGMPGVRRVAEMPPARHDLDQAAQLINGPQAWDLSGGVGNAGAGVKIAILDTGIDQNHPGFQDSSLAIPDGFPLANTEEDKAYTNNKIIVARSYVDMLIGKTGQDDDRSPRDHIGLGTAEAMIAAGVQNSGPSATITGIAPKAWLGNYKIFGSPGVNDNTYFDVIIKALEDAFNDGMNVVVLAWGSPALYGPLELNQGGRCDVNGPEDEVCDVRAQAVENAVAKGMVVVTSAGNDGEIGQYSPTWNTIHTPGTAPSAITVGASSNTHYWFSTVSMPSDAPTAVQGIPGRFGDGPKPDKSIQAPLRDITKWDRTGLGCSALPQGVLNGAVALIQRGTCAFWDKVANAQKAGAVAVVLYREGGGEFPFVPTNLVGSAVPLVLVGNTDGMNLRAYVASKPDATVTLDPLLVAWKRTDFDSVESFSSRGPSVGDATIKPELVAPGSDIYTATQSSDQNSDLYDATGYAAMDGTSFAAPMVAGAVALVKSVHPEYTAAQLKSAVVNTANPNVGDGGYLASIAAMGAGRLDAAAAMQSTVTVEPATAGFGAIYAGTLPVSRTFNITNTSNQPIQLTLAIEPFGVNPLLTVAPASLSLDPGQSASVALRLDGSLPNAGSYEGFVTVKGGAVDVRIPYMYLVPTGQPDNIFPVLNAEFTGKANETQPCTRRIAFRLIDATGIGIPNVPVVFAATYGGGTISGGDAKTDNYGMAAANVCLGPTLGDQEFGAQAGGLTVYFYGTALQ